MNTRTRFIAGLLLLVAVILAYFPGLNGELIFDDRPNLTPVFEWQQGVTSWQEVVFENDSGRFGRPVSMASFLLSASVGENQVFAHKATNLFLHILTGLLIYLLLVRLIACDERGERFAKVIPLAVTAVWLLHPMLVSTVLYTVQRMAILSALFVVLAMLLYIEGRKALDADRVQAGSVLLLIGVPAATALAVFSKENGILAPYFCLILEWIYFSPKAGSRRPWPVRLFCGIFIFVLLVASAYLLYNPDFLLAGYGNRHFDLTERLLTQSRVLFDYLGNLLLPVGPKLTIFRENYPLSHGLLTPVTTIFSIVGWIAIVVLIVKLRRIVPGFSAGMSIFLLGHSLESGPFPLMLYFEHRNYLPSIGVLLAVAAVIAALAPIIKERLDSPRILAIGSLLALVTVLGLATYMRAGIWESNRTMAEQSLQYYPDSRLLRGELAQIYISQENPEPQKAIQHMEYLLEMERPSTKLIGALNILNISCRFYGRVSEFQKEQAFSLKPDTMEPYVKHVIRALSETISKSPCEGLSQADLLIGLNRILNIYKSNQKAAAPAVLQYQSAL